MILTVDIGNSNIVSVLYGTDGEKISDDRRLTLKESSYEKYQDIFEDTDIKLGGHKPQAVMLSCVVPSVRDAVMDVLSGIYPESPIYNLQRDTVPGLKIRLKQPRELGADIIATSLGAYKKYGGTSIVADLGSATKISVISEKFEFYGGIIMPGIEFQARSLNQMIPHLPLIEIKKPEMVLGNGTTESIQSGIIYGTLDAVKGLSDRIEKEMGTSCRRIITGGLSRLYTKEELGDFCYDEFLLNEGLYYAALELKGGK